MSSNTEISEVLDTYPDKVADALEEMSRTENEMERAYSKAYLKAKEGKGMSIEDAKHHAILDDDYIQLRDLWIAEKVKHTRLTGKLLSARKQAELVIRGL